MLYVHAVCGTTGDHAVWIGDCAVCTGDHAVCTGDCAVYTVDHAVCTCCL